MKWSPTHRKPLVCVHWRDADSSSPTEAFYEDDIKHRTTPMETYGLLMKQDNEGITLMNEFYKEDDGRSVFRGRNFIPNALIDRVEVLVQPKQPKPRKPTCSGPSQLPSPSSSV